MADPIVAWFWKDDDWEMAGVFSDEDLAFQALRAEHPDVAVATTLLGDRPFQPEPLWLTTAAGRLLERLAATYDETAGGDDWPGKATFLHCLQHGLDAFCLGRNFLALAGMLSTRAPWAGLDEHDERLSDADVEAIGREIGDMARANEVDPNRVMRFMQDRFKARVTDFSPMATRRQT